MVLTDTDRENCNADVHCITVSNIKTGEVLTYPLILLKGHVFSRNQPTACRWPEAKLQMRQYSSGDKTPIVSNWPVVNTEFKCLLRLSQGNNHVILEYCGTTYEFMVVHQPRETVYHVLPVYIICRDHDGQFQAPASEDNTVHSACKRISLGTRLIQCLIAEKLKEAGFERKTFQLEQDINPSSPECVIFYSQLEVEEARKMKGVELWEYFGRELMLSSLGRQDRKFLAFLSCTRYNHNFSNDLPKTHSEIIQQTEAHVALGGGGLAIFGTACLHTWAARVEEIMPRFLNQNKVDTLHFMDDSCYRGTYGGCFATTLGSVCHELGHTFDLGHSSEGIMGRGFDNFDLVFTLHSQNNNDPRGGDRNVISPVCKEQPQHSTVSFTKVLNVSYTAATPMKNIGCKSEKAKEENTCDIESHSPNGTENILEKNCNELTVTRSGKINQMQKHCVLKSNGDCTYWSKSCAALLNFHRWFNNEGSAEQQGTLDYDAMRDAVVSEWGICVAEVRDDSGLVLCSWEFLDTPGVKVFPLTQECRTEGALTLVVEDIKGNVLKHSLM